MYASKFNYMADCQKAQKKLLMNFLTRSADIIDSEFADHFLHGIEKGKLTNEEKNYLMERGYVFSDKDLESQTLRQLYENELKNSVPIYTVYLGIPSKGQSQLDAILKSINEIERGKNEKIRSELILYCKNSLDLSPVVQGIEEFIKNRNSLNLSIKLVTTQKYLPFSHSFFTKRLVADIVLVYPLSEFGRSIPFSDDIEEFLNQSIERGKNVTIDVKLNRKDVKNIKPLVNYFVRRGWPFLDNFKCRLEPEDNETCIFGYWYNSDIELPREIFKVFSAYPQTEFCSMEKWIGINVVNTLIWQGRLPSPSFHFCNASKGLVVFTTDGNIFPCLKMAEVANETFLKNRTKFKDFRQRNGRMLSDCRQCKYILSCGGGCSYKAITHNNGRVCCPPVKELIEVSLETYFGELLEKSKFLDQYQEEIKS